MRKKTPEPSPEENNVRTTLESAPVPADINSKCDKCSARAKVLMAKPTEGIPMVLTFCLHHFHLLELALIIDGFKIMIKNV